MMNVPFGRKIIWLMLPLGLYSLAGLFVTSVFPGGGLYSTLCEKSLCILLAGFFVRKDREVIRWERPNTGIVPVILAAIAGAGASLGLNCIVEATGLSAKFPEAYNAGNAGEILPLKLFAFVLLTPVAEELLFRGVFFRRLRTMTGAWPAIIIGAAVFGLFHGNLLQGMYAFVLGLVICALFEKYDRVIIAVFFHAAANALSFAVSESSAVSAFFGADCRLWAAAGCLVSALALIFCMRRKPAKTA